MNMDRKEYMREYFRQYRAKNREKLAEKHRGYYKTENGKKSTKISGWKRRGIIADSWDEVYAWYIETETCDICDRVLTTDRKMTSSTKCLDHDHSIKDDYNIRGVICNTCNVSENSESENRYVIRFRSGYRFRKSIKGKEFSKCFGTLEEAIAFRDAFRV